MFHTDIVAAANTGVPEFPIRAFIAAHREALGHAAVLLGGNRGAALINAIDTAFEQSGPITRRLTNLLLQLRDMLFLEHTHDMMLEDAGCFALIDPSDPVVEDICLLADGLDKALRQAKIVAAAID
ncbi:hypothetical protein [Pararhodobacter oceanensis]|uniref:hypothetical protein n=1 Tax=Pararhodobacter oceanensis TaxID=2172121 RepID=UPI003A8FD61C